jgi:hypothetical protein
MEYSADLDILQPPKSCAERDAVALHSIKELA